MFAQDSTLISLLLAVGLAAVHLFANRLLFLDTIPRSRWLSIAGGASVAYVFIHIFPELSSGQTVIEQANHPLVGFLEHHVYLLALLGFAVFYGLERIAKESRQQNREAGGGDTTTREVFWLHIASFAIYNLLIGYLLLHREEPGLHSLVFFFLAMALHFVVNDYGLREHHKKIYRHIGRWILAAAVLLGWGIGRATEVDEAAIALFFAFLAGGVILNVLKEELPEERDSRFWAFALGAGVYTALLLGL
ncbi:MULTISPECIES: hypothetical protein [unclassified Coleofasciculus]|uniref:hypothetical protein n=1 Tax=unclassified Coleofasciculus TaxID=2692782 RepID=UPI0018816DE2|nr:MULTISPECIES: hypothetical protein [unclassified Coleofasciculus]MBE9128384.1 hypothetical protein [Coleofasciculus sp. LEGE 07081]MBE9147904.1 hypothetical protein [Coleofasciculus sp. LEGE 07092]